MKDIARNVQYLITAIEIFYFMYCTKFMSQAYEYIGSPMLLVQGIGWFFILCLVGGIMENIDWAEEIDKLE